MCRSPKPLHLQFEDDLAELIDQYLVHGVVIRDLKEVLLGEAENDHEQIRLSLRARLRRANGSVS
jgi:hypothetical protein